MDARFAEEVQSSVLSKEPDTALGLPFALHSSVKRIAHALDSFLEELLRIEAIFITANRRLKRGPTVFKDKLQRSMITFCRLCDRRFDNCL